VANLGEQCEFSNRMWKFDVLSLPKLREIAVADALEADIIIISCQGGELPSQVKEWIEDWLTEGSNAMALVALLREDNQQAQQTARYLGSVAQVAGMEFFCQPEVGQDAEVPEQPAEPVMTHESSDRNGRTLSALAGVVRRDVTLPRWDSLD
jgi:hypothetical protein